MLEIGALALLAVVAVYEEEVDRLGRRLGALRICHVQLYPVCQAVSLEDARELAIERRAITPLTSVDVVRVEYTLLQRRGDEHGAAAAKPSDLDHSCRLRVPH